MQGAGELGRGRRRRRTLRHTRAQFLQCGSKFGRVERLALEFGKARPEKEFDVLKQQKFGLLIDRHHRIQAGRAAHGRQRLERSDPFIRNRGIRGDSDQLQRQGFAVRHKLL